jgi:hypothetical protein
MKKLIASAVVAASLAAFPAAPAIAHTCTSAGTKHAVINGSHKCLKTGQFCRRASNAQYRRYGFRCVTGSDGRARLRKA